MARFNRCSGPPANFQLTDNWQNIPGLSVTRQYGNGPILVLLHANFFNNSLTNMPARLGIRIDATLLATPFTFLWVGMFEEDTLEFSHLLPPMPGTHTITAVASGQTAEDDYILANSASFSLYELPLVDDPALIT